MRAFYKTVGVSTYIVSLEANPEAGGDEHDGSGESGVVPPWRVVA